MGLALITVAGAAQAQQAPNDTPYETIHNHITVDVNGDGTFTQTFDHEILLRTQAGVQGLTQTSLAFSESLQDGEFTEVYTLKKDGRRIVVPADQIFLRASPIANGAPSFNDYKVRIGVFQNVEVGDKVGFKGVIHQRKPLMPGQFSYAAVFSRSQLIDEMDLTVSAPAKGYPLKIDAARIDNAPPVERDGRLVWHWSHKNDAVIVGDDAATVDEFERGSRVLISSMPDYATLARLYEQEAVDKSKVSPAIAELAESITAGKSDRREQARALYEWVAENIRYVAIAIGTGAMVPHPADEVLKNRYGDCKDHVALLQALLTAKGIPSSGALIGTNRYQLPAVAGLIFNHIITYIPEFDVYADSTARHVPFGVLPYSDVARPVVLTASGKVAKTPNLDPAHNGVKAVTRIRVKEDGDAEADTEVTSTGVFAATRRAQMANLVRPDLEEQFLRSTFGNNAEGKLEKGDWRNLGESYAIRAHLNYTNFIAVPGPGALGMAILTGGDSVNSSVYGGLPKRKFDYACGTGILTEETVVELPKNMKLLALPKGGHWESDYTSFDLSYEKIDERTVKTVRSFVRARPEAVCTPEMYAKLFPEILKMRGGLRASVIYVDS